MAYAYHSTKGFVLLSWVLLSFMLPLLPFVNFTVLILLPIFTLEFLYIYVMNIPLLFNLSALNNFVFTYFGY